MEREREGETETAEYTLHTPHAVWKVWKGALVKNGNKSICIAA